MQENQLLTLVRALKEINIAAERINYERREIVRRIDETERDRKRLARATGRKGVPKARFVRRESQSGISTET